MSENNKLPEISDSTLLETRKPLKNNNSISTLIKEFEKKNVIYRGAQGLSVDNKETSFRNSNDNTDFDLKQQEKIEFPSFVENMNRNSDSLINIDSINLIQSEKIDEGFFGVVYKGIYKVNDGSFQSEILVAIKELKTETEENQKEIRKEAALMAKLNHPNIIKLIGISHAENFGIKIVLEFASLGSLHKYLKFHKNEIEMKQIVKFCHQISLAMEYLHRQSIVHRDLAARNVLLVDQETCKVTDFGLSRNMNDNNYYYLSEKDALLPLKWYPIDLIKAVTKRFDEKSDVYSFGITVWEVCSYGKMPFEGCKTIDMLVYFMENGYKLEQPENCPNKIYDIMLKCWYDNKEDRPTFLQIVNEFDLIITEKIENSFEYISTPLLASSAVNNELFDNKSLDFINKKKIIVSNTYSLFLY